jgi:hypothetical protein
MSTKLLLLVGLLVLSSCTNPSDAAINVVVGTPTGAPPAPVNYVSDANCMGAWYMNGAATETDQTGLGNTMNQTSGTIPTSADVPAGYAGTSRDLELGDSEDLEGDVTSGTELHITTTSLTVVAWIKSETTDYTSTAHVAGIYDSAGNKRMYRLGVSTAEKAGFYVSVDGTAYTAILSSTTVADAAWHHIAGVFDNTNDLIHIYVDGSSDGDPVAHVGNISDQISEFNIGAFSASSAYYDGLMDEVAVFNRALSAAEILEIKTTGISGNKGGSD